VVVAKVFDFGELRSLLQQAPSEAVWEALYKLVGSARWDKEAEVWLPYAADYLDRGWPDALRVWPAAWRKKAPQAVELVRSMTVEGHKAGQLEVAASALEAGRAPITGLTLNLSAATIDGVARVLAAAPRSLRRLRMVREAAPDALLASGVLGRLEALSVEQARLGDYELVPLLEALGPDLRELGLAGCARVTGVSAEALVKLGLASRLESLNVSRTSIIYLAPHLRSGDTSEAVGKLAQTGWPALRALNLWETFQHDHAALGLMFVQMPALARLELGGNPGLGNRPLDEALHKLRGPLESLGLHGCSVHDVLGERLLGLPALAELKEIKLGGNTVGARTGAALRGVARTLEVLELVRGDHRGAVALLGALEGHELPALRQIGISPSVEVVETLARVELPALRVITHEHTGEPAAEVMEAIRRAPWGAQIERVGGR
jgi:hypothetical protein